MHLSQQFVDVPAVLLGLIEEKNNLGRSPQPEPLHQFVADKTGSGFQARQRLGPLGGVSRNLHEYAHGAHAGSDANFRDAERHRQARIFQLTGQHQADFIADLFRDSFRAKSADSHSSSSKYSTWLEARSRPRMRSDSAAIA
jgi:hypothetical protein